jgi:hypothetical protein
METSMKNPPWCPFCGQRVGRAVEAAQRKLNEFPVGGCMCGAVFACDVTGHNVGAAMVEALVHACNDNWDLAWELMPEDDYLTGRIENYDEEKHEVLDKGNVDGRPVRGVLYFVRLHTEIADIAKRVADKKIADLETPVTELIDENKPQVEPAPDKDRPKKRANKQLVRRLVEDSDIDGLVALCFDDKKTLRLLQRMLYAPTDEQRWLVVWSIGQVTARVSTREPGQVSELLHRLYEACNDSAATHWGMVETIGAIIAGRPDIFGAFTRYLLNFVDQDTTRVEVIWSLAEIARTRPDLIRDTPFYTLFHFLQHPDAGVRGQLSRLLGRIHGSEASMQLMPLTGDKAELVICEDGKLVSTTVGAEAAKALQAIQGGLKKNE